jgi:hypothetical protein
MQPIVSAARHEARILRFRPPCGKCVSGLAEACARLLAAGAQAAFPDLESVGFALIVQRVETTSPTPAQAASINRKGVIAPEFNANT